MPNILLTRIDARLIHGQVATQWCGVLGANLLLVANDAVANDQFRQGLMNMAAPSYAQTTLLQQLRRHVRSSARPARTRRSSSSARTPQDVLRLVEGGVPIKKVNIGNMHMAEGEAARLRLRLPWMMHDVASFQKGFRPWA